MGATGVKGIPPLQASPLFEGLEIGDTFKLHNSQDYFGDVISATYTGGDTISIPMTGHTVALPIGADVTAPVNPSTFPDFGEFYLMKD